MTARKTNLQDPIYHDDDAARAHLESLLWPHGPVCPHCSVIDNATAMKGATTRAGLYKCKTKECRKPFTVTLGTVMERSHIALHKWVLAAHFMAASKKGMSALQLQRMMGLASYESAWFLFHRLREATKDYAPTALGGEGKFVEADTTYIGGKEKNKHASKRNPKNIGGMGKQAVHTLVERDGRARSFHVANVTGKTLRPIIAQHVSRKSALMTDTDGSYFHIAREFARFEMVNHSKGEYVRLLLGAEKGRLRDVPPRLRGPPSPLPVRVRLPVFDPRRAGDHRRGARRGAAARRPRQAPDVSTACDGLRRSSRRRDAFRRSADVTSNRASPGNGIAPKEDPPGVDAPGGLSIADHAATSQESLRI